MHSPLRFLPSVFFKRRPIHFTLFVTERCNARCPFCFYVKREKSGERGEELTKEEIIRFAPSIGKLLWLAFSGGEIFLREDLPEISRVLYRHTRPSIMLYPTNGLMPDRIREMITGVLRDCTDSVIVVKLSLDAVGGRHDEMRGIGGCFEKVMETYESLRGLLREYRTFELGVNTVFSARNQNDVGDVISFVKGLEDIKTHTISMVRGDVVDSTSKDVDYAGYLEAIKSLEADLKDGSGVVYRFGGARIKAAQDIIQRRIIHKTAATNRRQLRCYAGRLNVVMTETGDIYPCETFKEDFRFGNIRDSGFDLRSVLDGEKAQRKISEIGSKCFCTHECFMMTNILFNPLRYPSLLIQLMQMPG